jgi:hypothetical protein
MGKHTPNTSEPSYPHEGKFGKEHIDVYHFGRGGEKKETKHITDPGMIRWGEKKKEYDEGKAGGK